MRPDYLEGKYGLSTSYLGSHFGIVNKKVDIFANSDGQTQMRRICAPKKGPGESPRLASWRFTRPFTNYCGLLLALTGDQITPAI